MKRINRMLCALSLFLMGPFCFASSNVTDYQRIFSPVYTEHDELRLAIRMFQLNNIPSFLLVNPQTLETSISPIVQLKSRKIKQDGQVKSLSFSQIKNTRYYQLLDKSTAAPYPLEGQGIKYAKHGINGVVLTIDLCPSIRVFESKFFDKLVQKSKNIQKPVPIAIAITGLWLIQHPDEFQWLQTQKQERNLDITWVNHSFSHVYYNDLPFSENFLLISGTNVEVEILAIEQVLIESGEVPSVFFRFPGLVSNERLVKQLKEYGLIPLATNTWVARLKNPAKEIIPTSVVLVHGNSNEPEGIKELMPLIERLNFLDIKQAL